MKVKLTGKIRVSLDLIEANKLLRFLQAAQCNDYTVNDIKDSLIRDLDALIRGAKVYGS